MILRSDCNMPCILSWFSCSQWAPRRASGLQWVGRTGRTACIWGRLQVFRFIRYRHRLRWCQVKAFLLLPTRFPTCANPTGSHTRALGGGLLLLDKVRHAAQLQRRVLERPATLIDGGEHAPTLPAKGLTEMTTNSARDARPAKGGGALYARAAIMARSASIALSVADAWDESSIERAMPQ